MLGRICVPVSTEIINAALTESALPTLRVRPMRRSELIKTPLFHPNQQPTIQDRQFALTQCCGTYPVRLENLVSLEPFESASD